MKAQEYDTNFSHLRENLIGDIKTLLRDKMRLHNKKSIDLFYYTDVENIVDKPGFPTCNKNGYGVMVFIAAIKLGEKDWEFSMEDEDSESWDTWGLYRDYDFSTEGMVEVLRLLQEIFAYCEKNNTKIVGIGDYDYTTDTLAR